MHPHVIQHQHAQVRTSVHAFELAALKKLKRFCLSCALALQARKSP